MWPLRRRSESRLDNPPNVCAVAERSIVSTRSCSVPPNPSDVRSPIEYRISRAGLDGRTVVVLDLFFWDLLQSEELAAAVHRLLSRVEAAGDATVAILNPRSYRHAPEQTQDAAHAFVSRLRHCCAVVACHNPARGGYVVAESTDSAFPVGWVIETRRFAYGDIIEQCGSSQVHHGWC